MIAFTADKKATPSGHSWEEALIAIVNMGDTDGDPGGLRTYEVRINQEVITTFRHRRSEGLAVCLRQASDAVTRRHADDLSAILNHINQEVSS